jgi:hypothetical protein
MRTYLKFTFLITGSLLLLLLDTNNLERVSISYDISIISISIGAAVLSLVAIISGILTSNENNRRNEQNDIFNRVKNRIEEKERINLDISFNDIYNNSKNVFNKLIDLNKPLKYSESIIGIFSFYSFLITIIVDILNGPFIFEFFMFLIGLSSTVGYVLYIVDEFYKIDKMSIIPDIKSTIKLLSIKFNDDYNKINDPKNVHLTINDVIRRIECKIEVIGEIRSGFLHTTIIYGNGMQSFIPDRNTFLMEFGFIRDYILTLLQGEDTGLLQGKINSVFDFNILIHDQKNEKTLIAKGDVPPFVNVEIYKNCTIPDNVPIKEIQIRLYEDPLYRPNYKRRVSDTIIITIMNNMI